jgi:hypothetical protein
MKNRFGILLSLLILFSPALSWSGPLVSQDQLSARAGNKYSVFPMKSSYREKDQRKGVAYFTAEEREQTRAVIINGVVYTNKGELFPDSRPAGGFQYVMDQAGNIYIFDDKPTIRHSSILAGEPVSAAGDIHVENGLITYIDVFSGHYFVLTSYSGEAQDNIIHELIARGVDTNNLTNDRYRSTALNQFDLSEAIPGRKIVSAEPLF